MDSRAIHLQPNHQVVVDRFTAACLVDERVVAAFLGGSYTRGTTDAYSDLDLGVITTDEAYGEFRAGTDAFAKLMGEPVFLEDFDLPNTIFIILPDGTEIDLSLGRESQFTHIHFGPYRVLVDKKNILDGAVFTWRVPSHDEQVETLRRLVNWFWHDLSHFTKAMARGQLWGAYGELDYLRLMCVNLARLRNDFLVEARGYEKLQKAIPTEQLTSLRATFCPMEEGAMLQAGLVIVRFYRELALSLAQAHGITYPVSLDRAMYGRLEKLCNERLS